MPIPFGAASFASARQVSGEQDEAMAITAPRASTSSRPERSITSWICLSFATMTKTTSAFFPASVTEAQMRTP
jgi:hypothetical protein